MAGSLYLGSQRVCPAIVIGGSGSDIYVGYGVDQDGKLFFQDTGDIVFSGFSKVGSHVLESMFSEYSITSADLSNLTNISGTNSCSDMFSGCTSLTSVDLGNLTTIMGSSSCSRMFSGCTSLTSVDLGKLETIKGNQTCGNMFSNCVSLTSLSFPSLKAISSTVFYNFLSGCSGVTMHFPSNMESTISGLTGYPNFGGTNTTLLFDLPSTA